MDSVNIFDNEHMMGVRPFFCLPRLSWCTTVHITVGDLDSGGMGMDGFVVFWADNNHGHQIPRWRGDGCWFTHIHRCPCFHLSLCLSRAYLAALFIADFYCPVSTSGSYIANRVSDKITPISAPFVYCCRSGSAADTQAIAEATSNIIKQHTCVL